MTATLTAAAAALLGAIAPGRSDKKKRRNIIILQRYFGLAGNQRCSMAEAGLPTPEQIEDHRKACARIADPKKWPAPPEPLTRESVRQIIAQAVDLIDATSASYQTLAAVFGELEAALPAAVSDLGQRLRDSGHIDDQLSVEGVFGLMELLGLHDGSIKVFELDGANFVGRDQDEFALRDLTSRAIKECSHNGAVHLPALMAAVKLRLDVPSITGAALAALDAEGGVVALTRREDGVPAWFMFSQKSRNRLLSCAQRVFTVFERVECDAFAEALTRYFRKGDSKRKESERESVDKDGKPRKRQRTPSAKTQIPPAEVIASALAAAGIAELEGKCLVARAVAQTGQDGPGEMESRIVKFLDASSTGTRREKEIENAVVRDVSEKFSFAMALNYSPLILRQRLTGKRRREPQYERGVYRLTGVGVKA